MVVEDFLRNLQSSGVVKSGTSPRMGKHGARETHVSTMKNGMVWMKFSSEIGDVDPQQGFTVSIKWWFSK